MAVVVGRECKVERVEGGRSRTVLLSSLVQREGLVCLAFRSQLPRARKLQLGLSSLRAAGHWVPARTHAQTHAAQVSRKRLSTVPPGRPAERYVGAGFCAGAAPADFDRIPERISEMLACLRLDVDTCHAAAEISQLDRPAGPVFNRAGHGDTAAALKLLRDR